MRKISVSLHVHLLLWAAKHTWASYCLLQCSTMTPSSILQSQTSNHPWLWAALKHSNYPIQRQPAIWATSSSCAVKMTALTPTASLTNTSRSTAYLFTIHFSHTVMVAAMPPSPNASSSDAAMISGQNTVYLHSLATAYALVAQQFFSFEESLLI